MAAMCVFISGPRAVYLYSAAINMQPFDPVLRISQFASRFTRVKVSTAKYI